MVAYCYWIGHQFVVMEVVLPCGHKFDLCLN